MPFDCTWRALGDPKVNLEPQGPASRTLAQWQAAWGIETILSNWPNLCGDTLAKLLVCVLLEQKVLLLGDAPRTSTVALTLRALAWPFRWLHLFLAAPPPPEVLNKIPLLEGTFPVILSLSELPAAWGYRTPYELLPEVVSGVLKHDYVYVSPELETPGGLRGGSAVKLPGTRHAALVKKLRRAVQLLRKEEMTLRQAAESVQDAFEAEIRPLVDLAHRFASHQVAQSRASGAVAAASSLEDARRQCSRQACDAEVFDRWLAEAAAAEAAAPSAGAVALGGEALAFHRTLFRTQLFLDLLNEEINAQLN
eukprot:TRINITY_DN880_c0_g6_i2.p1 TRINITY_DN880_c0_g6~~TRINITY_DN880_c0_g6_i2.p1  ORF type:complete len:309 (+),score=82.83 TRINITY_DN880_c0_g6_i2:438-1364(+)